MRFFKTSPHDCSYLSGRQATTVFIDPAIEVSRELYEQLNLIGFRRSGRHFYRPDCVGCQKCQSIRVDINQFSARRRHRRIIRNAGQLHWRAASVHYEAAYWDLYQRYINGRHANGDMYPPDQEDFYRFLLQQTQYGFLMEGWLDDHLMVVAVVDQLSDGLSAVYTFFDPDYPQWSLGKLTILQQINMCRQLGLPWLYLGYWIDAVPNMSYKADFQPVEIYRNDHWERLISTHP